MKKWLVMIALVAVGFMALLTALSRSPSDPSVRAVQLVITGPEGQRFVGTYVTDGKTNILNGVVPTTIGFRASQLTYNFKPADGREGLQVLLMVDNSNRVSGSSYKGAPVQGGWHAWHHDFRMLRDMVFSQGIFNKNSWLEWLDGESERGG